MNMQTLMAAEFFKLRKRMMTWVVTGLTVTIVILLYSVAWSISGKAGVSHGGIPYQEIRRALFLQSGVPFAFQIIASFGTLLAVILAAGAAGSEYAWGTVRLMATASSGRLRLIAARFIVVCGVIALLTLLAVAVAFAYSAVITAWSGGVDLSFVTAGYVKDQWIAYGRTLYVMAPYVALAFAAAVVGRGTLAGVGAGLGVAFLEPLVSSLMGLGGEPWSSVPNYLINRNTQAIMILNKLPAGLPNFGGASRRELRDEGAHSAEAAAIIIGIYILVFVAIAFYSYRRRDISSGAGG